MQEIISPLVSVVIPCYNAEKYINDTLVALEKQSYKNLQIILVNDGSKINFNEDSKIIILTYDQQQSKFVNFKIENEVHKK